MNTPDCVSRPARAAWPVCLAAIFGAPVLCAGASFKVASLDLAFSAQNPGEEQAARDSRLVQAATDLQAVQADIILLQGVRDWRMCDALAQKLKPADYSVIVCSSFRDLYVAAPAPVQTAILARHKGYFSWSSAWKGTEEALLPGGYAFAALTIGGQKVACFSTITEAPVPRDFKTKTDPDQIHAGAVQQILAQVGEVQRWVQNRPALFVLGGSLDPELGQSSALSSASYPFLTRAGFAQAPVHPQGRPACFFYSPGAGLSLRPIATGKDLLAYEVVVEAGKLASAPGKAANGQTAAAKKPANSRSGQAGGQSGTTTRMQGSQSPTGESVVKPPAGQSVGPSAPEMVTAPVAAKRENLASSQTAQTEPATAANSQMPPQEPVSSAATDETRVAESPAVAAMSRLWTRLNLPVSPMLAAGAAVGGLMLLGLPLLLMRRRRKRGSQRLLVARTEGSGPISNTNYVVVSAEDDAVFCKPNELAGLEPEIGSQTQTWQHNVTAEGLTEDSQGRPVLGPELREWMKQKLVQKMYDDRKNLLESQEEATFRAAHVTQRLAKIEQQIQEQSRIYQLRIDALTRELNAAREESRELLRARIAQVKAEMESARARLLASAERGEGV